MSAGWNLKFDNADLEACFKEDWLVQRLGVEAHWSAFQALMTILYALRQFFEGSVPPSMPGLVGMMCAHNIFRLMLAMRRRRGRFPAYAAWRKASLYSHRLLLIVFWAGKALGGMRGVWCEGAKQAVLPYTVLPLVNSIATPLLFAEQVPFQGASLLLVLCTVLWRGSGYCELLANTCPPDDAVWGAMRQYSFSLFCAMAVLWGGTAVPMPDSPAMLCKEVMATLCLVTGALMPLAVCYALEGSVRRRFLERRGIAQQRPMALPDGLLLPATPFVNRRVADVLVTLVAAQAITLQVVSLLLRAPVMAAPHLALSWEPRAESAAAPN